MIEIVLFLIVAALAFYSGMIHARKQIIRVIHKRATNLKECAQSDLDYGKKHLEITKIESANRLSYQAGELINIAEWILERYWRIQ